MQSAIRAAAASGYVSEVVLLPKIQRELQVDCEKLRDSQSTSDKIDWTTV